MAAPEAAEQKDPCCRGCLVETGIAPSDTTSWMPLSWPSSTLLLSLSCCFSTIPLIFQTNPNIGLVLFQYLGLKFPLPPSVNRHIHFAKPGTKRLAAVTAAAVVVGSVPVVILDVAQLIIQFCFQAVLHELGNGRTGPGYPPCCRCFSFAAVLGPSPGGRFLLGAIFLAICKTSYMVLYHTPCRRFTQSFGQSRTPRFSPCHGAAWWCRFGSASLS